MLRGVTLIEIEWVDSSHGGGWQFMADLDAEPQHCYTVGYLVRETDDAVTVATSVGVGNDGLVSQVCDCMTIPKSVIEKRRVIKRYPKRHTKVGK